MKKGLVVIYDPHSLQQFLWYYFTYGKETVWDALCLPNGYKGTYMDSYCVRSGIFNEVLAEDKDFLNIPLSEKLSIVLRMLGYALVGKRITCCKILLNKLVGDIDKYDELAAICDSGFVTGLIANLGKEKTVSFFDDGIGDYLPRDSKGVFKSKNFEYWQSLVLNRMGYGCNGRFFFKPTENCNKYSACTAQMKYMNYKTMKDMDMENTDMTGYNAVLQKTYPELQKIDYERVEAVLFTDDLEFFSENYQEFYDTVGRYIGKRYKNILLKRHPADQGKYFFGDDVNVQEVDNAIPAELLLNNVSEKKVYFTLFSSVILFMRPYHIPYTILYSKNIYEDNRKAASRSWTMPSVEYTRQLCERFNDESYEIIEM